MGLYSVTCVIEAIFPLSGFMYVLMNCWVGFGCAFPIAGVRLVEHPESVATNDMTAIDESNRLDIRTTL